MLYSERQTGIAAMISLAAVFSCMGLFARHLSVNFTLLQQVYLRLFAAFITGYLLFRCGNILRLMINISPREWLLIFFRTACVYLVAVPLYTKAIILTKFSNVAFLNALPFTAILGIVIFRERWLIRDLALIITSAIGITLVSASDFRGLLAWGEGELYALLANLFFAMSYVSRKWHSTALRDREITLVMLLLGFLMVLGASALFDEEISLPDINLRMASIIFAAGLFNIVALFLVNVGFRHVDGVLAANLLALESAFALFWGFMLYEEIPSVSELLGGVLIIVSSVGLTKIRRKE